MGQNVRIAQVSRNIYIVAMYTGHFWPASETAFHLRADSGLRPYAQPGRKSFFKCTCQQSSVATGILSPGTSSTSMLCACKGTL